MDKWELEMNDLAAKIKTLEAQYTEENRNETFEGIIDLICEYLAGTFEADLSEVALIILTSNEKFLRFLAPKKLYKGGATFPLSKRESLSTKVILTRKSDITNEVSKVKHLSIYEQVKTSEAKPKPIQKMLTVPLLAAEKPVGVIQISRKGFTSDEAGRDFTETDVQKLMAIIPCFLQSLLNTKPHSI